MLRTAIILATIVATFLGSLGLPVYLHACEMSQQRAGMKSSCSMCLKRSALKRDATGEGMRIKAKPCCTSHTLVQQTDPGALAKVEHLPAPLFAAFVSYLVIPQLASSLASPAAWTERPPPLASRAQATYLFNSTFLI
jgi:hypothetical protein